MPEVRLSEVSSDKRPEEWNIRLELIDRIHISQLTHIEAFYISSLS